MINLWIIAVVLVGVLVFGSIVLFIQLSKEMSSGGKYMVVIDYGHSYEVVGEVEAGENVIKRAFENHRDSDTLFKSIEKHNGELCVYRLYEQDTNYFLEH